MRARGTYVLKVRAERNGARPSAVRATRASVARLAAPGRITRRDWVGWSHGVVADLPVGQSAAVGRFARARAESVPPELPREILGSIFARFLATSRRGAAVACSSLDRRGGRRRASSRTWQQHSDYRLARDRPSVSLPPSRASFHGKRRVPRDRVASLCTVARQQRGTRRDGRGETAAARDATPLSPVVRAGVTSSARLSSPRVPRLVQFPDRNATQPRRAASVLRSVCQSHAAGVSREIS